MDPLTIALIVSAVSAGVTAIASKQASDAAEEAMLAENDRAVKERKAMFEREERERAARRGATTSFSPTQQGGQSVLGSTSAAPQSNNTTILGS